LIRLKCSPTVLKRCYNSVVARPVGLAAVISGRYAVDSIELYVCHRPTAISLRVDLSLASI